MKTLEQQMGFYAAYHQDARNKATHFVGVPAIMLSLFIPLAWLRIELGGGSTCRWRSPCSRSAHCWSGSAA